VHWQSGLLLQTNQCNTAGFTVPCEEGFDNVGQAVPAYSTWKPLETNRQVSCTALNGKGVEQFASDLMDATLDWSVGQELLTGYVTGNPNLQDSYNVTGNIFEGLTPTQAVGCLESYGATVGQGAQLWLHVSTGLVAYLAEANQLVADSSGQLWTVGGSKVVTSAGYDASHYGNNQFEAIYVTGDVWAATGPVEARHSVERGINRSDAWADQTSIAVFDPCLLAGAMTTIEKCTFVPEVP